tara:strand:- start:169 stop:432 length:264 start_codon:yes stop_codon:yes gene_type:complete
MENRRLIEQSILERLEGLQYIGDLFLEDSEYCFTAKISEGIKFDFTNKTFTVKEIDYSSISCYVKLSIDASFLDFCIAQDKEKLNLA